MHFAAEGRSLIEIFKVIEIIWNQEVSLRLLMRRIPEMDKGCSGTM
jgi:hypothetical protein